MSNQAGGFFCLCSKAHGLRSMGRMFFNDVGKGEQRSDPSTNSGTRLKVGEGDQGPGRRTSPFPSFSAKAGKPEIQAVMETQESGRALFLDLSSFANFALFAVKVLS